MPSTVDAAIAPGPSPPLRAAAGTDGTSLGEAAGEAVGEGDLGRGGDAVGVGVGDSVGDSDSLAEGLAAGLAVALDEAVGEAEGGDAVGESVGNGIGDSDGVGDSNGDALAEGIAPGLAVALGESAQRNVSVPTPNRDPSMSKASVLLATALMPITVPPLGPLLYTLMHRVPGGQSVSVKSANEMFTAGSPLAGASMNENVGKVEGRDV